MKKMAKAAALIAAMVLTAAAFAQDFPAYLKMYGTKITGCDKDDLPDNLVIPDGVTEIGRAAFFNAKLKSVVIPEGVTSIGDFAFNSCNKLASVTILDGVTFIGDSAFADCKILESVEIPTSVKKISESAFYSCDNLKEVKYAGTKAQWKKVKKSGETGLEGKTVVCTDGDVTVRANVLKKLLEL